MAVLEKGTMFDPQLVTDLINKVKGASSLAALSTQAPIPFNGQKEFVFTMDTEIDVVAENGAKSHGGVTLTPTTIVPIKVEYGARISDEFMYAAGDEQINILKSFNDGFAKKVARGLDLMAFHGVNPRTSAASTVIGANHFDSKVTQKVAYDSAAPDANVEAAVALVAGAGGEVTGMAISPTFSTALAGYKVNNVKQFPELAWGANPGSINGMPIDINRTVSDVSGNQAIVGDFTNAFKWGYAKQIPMEVIQYGDPDNSGFDLKGYNQVYLRAEVYLGWGILDATSFARITDGILAGDIAIVLKKGAASGTATDTLAPAKDAANSYLIKINGEVPFKDVVLAAGTDGWADYTAGADIVTTAGNKIILAEVVTASGKVVNVGEVVVEADDLHA